MCILRFHSNVIVEPANQHWSAPFRLIHAKTCDKSFLYIFSHLNIKLRLQVINQMI